MFKFCFFFIFNDQLFIFILFFLTLSPFSESFILLHFTKQWFEEKTNGGKTWNSCQNSVWIPSGIIHKVHSSLRRAGSVLCWWYEHMDEADFSESLKKKKKRMKGAEIKKKSVIKSRNKKWRVNRHLALFDLTGRLAQSAAAPSVESQSKLSAFHS